MAKATQLQSRERQETIFNMMLDGYSRYAIVRYCSNKWHIGSRQVDKYITKINEELNKTKAESFEAIKRRAIKRCERHRVRCREAGDRRTEAIMIKEINEIEGSKIQKHEITGVEGKPLIPAQIVIQLPDNGRSK